MIQLSKKELKARLNANSEPKPIETSSSQTITKPNVGRCGLSDVEYYEREMLLEKQQVRTKWFSQDNFERLKVLSEKMFTNAGSPHIG